MLLAERMVLQEPHIILNFLTKRGAMNFELLDMLSKAAGIGGICVGIFFLIISKTLKTQFLKLFPVKTAAVLVIFTVTLTWSVAVLGILVWINSDMKTYKIVSNNTGSDPVVNSTTSVESRATMFMDNDEKKDKEKKIDANSKLNQGNGYKSTNIVKSKTEIESEKKETENEMHQKTKVQTMASSISISFLNVSFTIIFIIFIILLFFISSCFYYNKHFVSEIKK